MRVGLLNLDKQSLVVLNGLDRWSESICHEGALYVLGSPELLSRVNKVLRLGSNIVWSSKGAEDE